MHLIDALHGSPVRYISARHEQVAAFMADGYARASGRVMAPGNPPRGVAGSTYPGFVYADARNVMTIWALKVHEPGVSAEITRPRPGEVTVLNGSCADPPRRWFDLGVLMPINRAASAGHLVSVPEYEPEP